MITSPTLGIQHLLAGHEASLHQARIRVETRSSDTMVRVRGEVDATTTDFLAVTLRFLAARTPLIVDVTRVKFLSISAIGVLLDLHNDTRCGSQVTMLTADGQMRRLMQVVSLCGAIADKERSTEGRPLVSTHRDRSHVA